MRGAGNQSSASFVIRSHVKPSFWLRCRSVRRDSLLEGDGFEPSVPRSPMSSVGAACRSCLRGSGSGSALLFPRLEPLRRAGLGHGLSRLWLAGLRGGFRLLVVQLIYTFALHRLNQQFAERPDQGINAVR